MDCIIFSNPDHKNANKLNIKYHTWLFVPLEARCKCTICHFMVKQIHAVVFT